LVKDLEYRLTVWWSEFVGFELHSFKEADFLAEDVE